mmetsp:Transcript_119573/g.283977  ORF Transcript_119573/g.283977 Transcript_119573/m.283977 type:complete len:235 (+) Transcript_119573:1594-2298(+)
MPSTKNHGQGDADALIGHELKQVAQAGPADRLKPPGQAPCLAGAGLVLLEEPANDFLHNTSPGCRELHQPSKLPGAVTLAHTPTLADSPYGAVGARATGRDHFNLVEALAFLTRSRRVDHRGDTSCGFQQLPCHAVAEDDVPITNQQGPRSDMWQCNAQALQHPSRCKIGAVDQLDSVAERGQVLIENISFPAPAQVEAFDPLATQSRDRVSHHGLATDGDQRRRECIGIGHEA